MLPHVFFNGKSIVKFMKKHNRLYFGLTIPFTKSLLISSEAQLLSDADTENGFEKGCALIRANLGIDPTCGDYEDWETNYAQALWLEKWRMKNQAEMLVKMFGSDK